MKKRYFSSFFISIFAVLAIVFGSFNYASAGFWDWFGVGNNTQTQKAEVITSSFLLPVLPGGDYKFDENSGSIAHDSSGNGGSGTITGATWTDGKNGSGLYFDGINDYVDLGNPASLQSNKISASAWFNTASGGMILRKRLNGYGLEVLSSGKVSFWINNSTGAKFSAISPNTYNNNGWHNAVGVYDGSTVKLYIDGVEVSSASAGVIYYGAGAIAVGRDGDYSGSYFNGKIDEVKIYNLALSSQEVLALYDKESKVSSSSSSTPSQSSITVLAPNGGEMWQVGSTQTIRWNTNNFKSTDIVQIEVWDSRRSCPIDDPGCLRGFGVIANVSNSGSYSWNVYLSPLAGFYGSTNQAVYRLKLTAKEQPLTEQSKTAESWSNYFSIINTSSSSSSVPGTLTAVTGGADAQATTATLYGTINNPKKESLSYYFNYRKETESSAETKQVGGSVNAGSLTNNLSRFVSDLSPGTKYVYRLYVYSYTTGQTVSGDLKSFTTPNFSNSSSISSAGSSSSAQPSITVLSPNGGERIIASSTHRIKWSQSGVAGNVFISRYEVGSNGEHYGGSDIVDRVKASQGYYDWVIPQQQQTSSWKIIIGQPSDEVPFGQTGGYDESDMPFSIISSSSSLPSIVLIQPEGGVFEVGQSIPVQWLTKNISSDKLVTISTYNPINNERRNMITNTLNDGEERWTLPTSLNHGEKYYLVLEVGCDSFGKNCLDTDKSDMMFTAVNWDSLVYHGSSSSSSTSSSAATIFSPNGGENWPQGTMQEIKYKSNAGYSLNIDLVKGVYDKKYVMNIGKTSVIQCVTTPCGPFNDRYQWTVPQYIAQGNDYFIRIGSEIGSAGYEFSDGPFTISPSVIPLPCTKSPCYSSSSSSSTSGGGSSRYLFIRELGYGSSGNDVTELQKRLTSEGYYSGPITGYYASMTGEAVKKYQISNGIQMTGYVGPQTISALNRSTVSSTSASSSSQGTSISQLIELFIALGIISPDKADLARASVKGM